MRCSLLRAQPPFPALLLALDPICPTHYTTTPPPPGQTTDKKVNECTPALFALAPDAAAMAALDVAAIEGCIRQLGLAPTKAKNLKAMAQVCFRARGGCWAGMGSWWAAGSHAQRAAGAATLAGGCA